VKLPVDKPWSEFKEIVKTCVSYNIHGVIIANLTKKREGIIERDAIKDLPG